MGLLYGLFSRRRSRRLPSIMSASPGFWFLGDSYSGEPFGAFEERFNARRETGEAFYGSAKNDALFTAVAFIFLLSCLGAWALLSCCLYAYGTIAPRFPARRSHLTTGVEPPPELAGESFVTPESTNRALSESPIGNSAFLLAVLPPLVGN